MTRRGRCASGGRGEGDDRRARAVSGKAQRGAGRAGQAEARRVGERAVRGAGRGELGRGVGRAVREGQATGTRGKKLGWFVCWAGNLVWAEALGWTEAGLSVGFAVCFPFHFSILILIQTTQILIEFKTKFEFKPYTLNQIKEMLQHECTNIFTLEKF